MTILIVVLIILLTLVLAGIGAFIVIQDKGEKEAPAEIIDRSGVYSVLRRSPRADLESKRPTLTDLRNFLLKQSPPPAADEVQRLLDKWNESFENSIQIVEQGDREGTETYRILLQEDDAVRCSFLPRENYITREQIYNHPEILPPYYPGCGARLVLKSPWDSPSKSGWKPLLPVEGVYKIPDWRQIGKS